MSETDLSPAQKLERVRIANLFLEAVARHGRHFFERDGRVSHFELDGRGRIWFVDKYQGDRIYTHTTAWARWRGFTEGGTLRRLVELLRDYIMGRSALPVSSVAPARAWTKGDIWGYGADEAEATRRACAALLTNREENHG